VENIFIITIDGFRWQELFNGADESLINNPKYTADTALAKMMWWAPTVEERRKKLLPFFWNVLGQKGALYGNRKHNNKVNVANLYQFSYPGYNEVLTGKSGLKTNSNDKKNNTNINVLEYLNRQKEYEGKVVAFTSWDVFPYILNKERNGLIINSGYQAVNYTRTHMEDAVNNIQDKYFKGQEGTRMDELTFVAAREYIQMHRPKVVFLSFGETDDYAHAGEYNRYLQSANTIDRMLYDLWQYIQSTEGYKNNTSFLITTDHGRGRKDKWTNHSTFVSGSSETWLAMIGPNIPALKEVKNRGQIYQKDYAKTIAQLVGFEFKP